MDLKATRSNTLPPNKPRYGITPLLLYGITPASTEAQAKTHPNLLLYGINPLMNLNPFDYGITP